MFQLSIGRYVACPVRPVETSREVTIDETFVDTLFLVHNYMNKLTCTHKVYFNDMIRIHQG